jgi:3-hydroxyisobutyrate dehydrogenase-like beta-hydroxyacid dehydrogenase
MSAASVLDTRRIGWIGLGKMGLPSPSDLPHRGSRWQR